VLDDFTEDMVKHLPAFKTKMKDEYGNVYTKNLRNKPVSEWEEKIYDHIREFTKYYDYTLITDVLNKTEVATHNKNIGRWTWDFVRAIVRRVEDCRGIESKERLHMAIKSVAYKKFIRGLCVKLKSEGLTYPMIAEELNKHKYPRHLLNTYTWSARSIGHIFDDAGSKRIKKVKDYVTYEE